VAPGLDLVGVSEIAEMLDVTRQRVDQLTREDGSFPVPVATLTAGRIWRRVDVERWAKKVGRL
jgi:prophage regulatory protein